MMPVRILLAALFVYMACRAAGQLLLRALRVETNPDERGFPEFILGAAAISAAVFLLASAHLVYTALLIAMGLGLVAVAALKRQAPGRARAPWWFWGPYLVFGGLYLVTAMCPEISPDGSGYHVGLVRRYLEHHGFYAIPNYMFAGLWAGIEMLFVPAFAIGRHSGTAVVHLVFLLTLPFGMMSWARRVSMPAAGVFGALLFYAAPIVGRDATVAYVDTGTAAVVFGVFWFLEFWRVQKSEGALAAAGILAGFAFACKVTVATVVPYAVLYVVFAGVRRGTPFKVWVRGAAVVGCCATAVVIPWAVKDAIQYGNPLFPLFNDWFPNPHQYPMVEREMRGFMAHVADIPYRQIPWEVVAGGRLAGVFGPVFALMPLSLLALRQKPGRALWLAFLPVFLPYFTNTGARFLIPCMPFAALSLGVAITTIPVLGTGIAIALLLAHSVLSWPTVIARWSEGWQWRIDMPDWRVALRIVPENTFLESWPDYRVGLMLDREVPAGETIFSPGFGQLAYHHRDLVGTFESAQGRHAFLALISPLSSPLSNAFHREIHFSAIRTQKIRVVVKNRFDTDLRIGELRFRLGSREIPREPGWRLRASANPWEVQDAFDNSRASFWTAGRSAEPGQWLEVDFGHPTDLDWVVVEQSEDQRWISLAPSAWQGNSWKALRAREADTLEPARESFRREIRDELKRLGIRWILIRDGAYGADDLRDRAAWWGITYISEANGLRLWKLN